MTEKMEPERRIFNKGDVIMTEGCMESGMYDIVIGSVGIYKNYGTGYEEKVAVLGDGEYFGEMEMATVRARSATVVALEKTETIFIDRETFGEYFRNKPEKVLTIMQQLSDRLRRTTEAYAEARVAAREALEEIHKGIEPGSEKSRWYDRLWSIVEDFGKAPMR